MMFPMHRKGEGGSSGKWQEDVLWMNESPDSTFAAQSVTLSADIDNYDLIGVYYKYRYDRSVPNDPYFILITPADLKTSVRSNSTRHNVFSFGGIQSDSNSFYSRDLCYESNTQLYFTLCYLMGGSGNTTESSIPLKIVGIKLNDPHGAGRYEKVVLWENPSPGSSMASGTELTCSDDFKNYDFIGITYNITASSARPETIYLSVPEMLSYRGTNAAGKYNRAYMGNIDTNQNYAYLRGLYVSADNKFKVAGGWYASSSVTTAATSVIPIQVFGIRLVEGTPAPTDNYVDFSAAPDQTYSNSSLANNGTANISVVKKPSWIIFTLSPTNTSGVYQVGILNVEKNTAYRWYYSSSYVAAPWTNINIYITSVTDTTVSIKNSWGTAARVYVAIYYDKNSSLPLIPTMTSDTAPKGQTIYSSVYSTYNAWKAFDNVISYATSGASDKWVANDVADEWIGYIFDRPTVVNKAYILADVSTDASSQIHQCAKNIKIQASNDGTTWTDLVTRTLADTAVPLDVYIEFDNKVAYTRYRLYIVDQWIESNARIAIRELQFYENHYYPPAAGMPTYYSAANDTLYILDNGTQVPIAYTDEEGKAYNKLLSPGTYTIYSTVAKNPNDLTEPYSKTVTITSNTIGIEMFPVPRQKILYWYGYFNASKLEECNTTNGWNSCYGVTPTYNTNFIDLYAGNTSATSYVAVGLKSALSDEQKLHLITKGIESSTTSSISTPFYVRFGNGSNKNSEPTTFLRIEQDVLTHTESNISSLTGQYGAVFCCKPGGGTQTRQRAYLYALWYE